MRRLLSAAVMLLCGCAWGQRYVVVDQDGQGPGDSDQQSILLLLQARDVKVLGVTMVAGDVPVDEGARHTLRMLEMVGRTEVPVVTGASAPLVRTREATESMEKMYGRQTYVGAFGGPGRGVKDGVLVEGEPKTKPMAGEDAAHFLIATVHRYPHEVTVFAGGPMTNVALAVRLDPTFAETAKELVFMGGSLNPKTDDPEFAFDPRHEFNFWFDPEAAHIVLTAGWKKMTGTTIDASVLTTLRPEVKAKVKGMDTAAARYMARYASGSAYLWDELAAMAWIDPAVVKKVARVRMDVDIDHGHGYGDTLTWADGMAPEVPVGVVDVNMTPDMERFEAEYLKLMAASGR